jgi:CRISPR-associated protein Csx17
VTLHVHRLAGCTPRPLAGYLKALAVLRIVAEQKDPRARGFWRAGTFHLVTELDATELVRFFLDEWQPTPFVSPWNKGSGFFNLEKDKGLAPVRKSTAPRFAALRAGIEAGAEVVSAMETAVRAEKAIKEESNQIKDRTKREALRRDLVYKQRLARATRECKRLKDELQPECQRRWRGGALRWLRAAMVLHGDGGKAEFPSLLGTGGNDGKLDFSNNAYQRLADLFDLASAQGSARPDTHDLLRASLFGDAVPGQRRGAIGQFSPATSGGANSTSGALGESMLNPWDLPLLLEGAILFSAASTKRLARRESSQASAPFSVRGHSSGYGSASAKEEGAADAGAEQWMPIWDRPWTIGELRSVLAEGRCQLGARVADSGLDAARAVARLGVARGISSFERYGYLVRNGKSSYAVPLGSWNVQARTQGALLDDLDQKEWWRAIRRAARDERAPASFVRAERVLADAVLAALAGGDAPRRWREVLVALATLEHQLVASGAFTYKARLAPLPSLSPEWIRAIDYGGPEVRLALALASARDPVRKDDTVRAHWLPLDPRTRRFKTRENGLARDPRVVCAGRRAEDDLVTIVERRLLEGQAGHSLPLVATPGTAASPADLNALITGQVDLELTLWLARALAAVRWWELGPAHLPGRAAGSWDPGELDPSVLAVRLAHLPFAIPRGAGAIAIGADPAAVRLLASGDSARAFEVVLRRLQAAGLRAPFRFAAVDAERSRRIAASLAFPITRRAAGVFAGLLDPATFEKELTHAV